VKHPDPARKKKKTEWVLAGDNSEDPEVSPEARAPWESKAVTCPDPAGASASEFSREMAVALTNVLQTHHRAMTTSSAGSRMLMP
jgi:hypothetical protein